MRRGLTCQGAAWTELNDHDRDEHVAIALHTYSDARGFRHFKIPPACCGNRSARGISRFEHRLGSVSRWCCVRELVVVLHGLRSEETKGAPTLRLELFADFQSSEAKTGLPLDVLSALHELGGSPRREHRSPLFDTAYFLTPRR